MQQNDQADVRKIAMLIGVVLAVMVAIGNLYWQVLQMRTEMGNLRESILSEVTKLAEATEQAAKSSKRAPVPAAGLSQKVLDTLKQELTEELSATQRQALAAALHAKTEAVSHADKLAESGQERQTQHKK